MAKKFLVKGFWWSCAQITLSLCYELMYIQGKLNPANRRLVGFSEIYVLAPSLFMNWEDLSSAVVFSCLLCDLLYQTTKLSTQYVVTLYILEIEIRDTHWYVQIEID